MSIAATLVAALQVEADKTKKILSRIPEASLGWKPHEKSMSLGRLGMHIAELPDWITRCVDSECFDFAIGVPERIVADTHAQIMEKFEDSLEKAVAALQHTTDVMFAMHWQLKRGEQIIQDMPRTDVISNGLHHIIHHCGQLSVYLRMLDVPLPNMFGPTADER